MKKGSIPEPLTVHYELLKELDTAYDLLDCLKRGEKDATAEEAFLEQKISHIESCIASDSTYIEGIIEQIADDSTAWTIARLRFIHGYEWKQAADRLHLSTDMVKSRVYRGFQKVPDKALKSL